MTSIDGLLDMESEVLSKGKRKRETVSCHEYYCYKIQIRENEPNETLHSGRVFQQYVVDQYIKLETQRLHFFSFNQDLFRTVVLQGILDLLRQGERDASKIGKKILFLLVLLEAQEICADNILMLLHWYNVMENPTYS